LVCIRCRPCLALTLAMVLGFGLPSLMASMGLLAGEMPSLAGLAAAVATTSGVRALLVSIPVVLGSVVLIRTVMGAALAQGARMLPGVHGRLLRRFPLAALSSRAPLIILLVGTAIVMLLWFGLVNHRSMERHTRRVCVQGVWLFSTLAIAAFLAMLM
jgi:hypothetical protein